jgi:hypothetical protein
MKILILNIIVVFVLQLSTCNKKSKNTDNSKIANQEVYTDFGDCYNDRETTKVIENSKGKIIKVNDNVWAIQPVDNSSQRYGICQLPEILKKENLSVTFNGEVKKINPNERLAASPFNLKELKIVEK